MQYKFELLLGLVLGIAWLFPFSPLGLFFALLTVVLSFLLVKEQIGGRKIDKKARQKSILKQSLATGPIFFSISCHWLFNTINEFGGFNIPVTFLLFAGFILIQTLTFLVIYWAMRLVCCSELGTVTKHLLISLSSWGALEFFPSLFPWSPGHFLYGFGPATSLASIGGAHFAFFVFYLFIAFLFEIFTSKRDRRRYQIATLIHCLLIATLFIVQGSYYSLASKDEDLSADINSSKKNLSLVQGNISIKDKHDPGLFGDNIKTYQKLTEKIPEDHLVIWPETVIHRFLPLNDIDKVLDSLPIGIKHGLIGALTYADEEHFYNSAIAINNGKYSGLQHKRVLMPFGEYVPFGKYFPFLNRVAGIGNFTPASSAELINFNLGSDKISVGVLNCYEDMLPKFAFNYRGADLLVNITNDGWFDTLAMRQHALVASFRSVELGIPLVRATNSGLTSVFDADGNLVKSLAPGSAGVLSVRLPRKKRTLYGAGGHYLNKFALLVFSIIVASSVLRKKFK